MDLQLGGGIEFGREHEARTVVLAVLCTPVSTVPGPPTAAGSVPTPPLRLRYMSSHSGMYPNMTGTLVSSKPLENSKVQSFGIPWLGIV